MSYGDVLAAQAAFLASAVNYQVLRLQANQSLSSEERTVVRDLFAALSEAAGRVDLWGPSDVVAQAYALRTATGRMFVALVGWAEALDGPQGDNTASHSAEYQAAFEGFKEARTAFVGAAIKALHD
ncbi:hypothetical protein AMK11_20170 [Streptomyces sp. CB02414]|nr:hypothetical protein AMK11_20170 [Streptomyces sp. CB02414]